MTPQDHPNELERVLKKLADCPETYGGNPICKSHLEEIATILAYIRQSNLTTLKRLREKYARLSWGHYDPFQIIDEAIKELEK